MYVMRLLRASVTALLLVISCLAAAQDARPPIKPGKIFIGNFGTGEDADQLKVALGYELGQAGFKVIDFLNQADSWMSGLIVTRVENGKQIKRVTVFLKDRKGNTLWDHDIGANSSGSRQGEDAIRQRAQEIARELKKATTPAAPAKKVTPPRLSPH